MKEHKNTEDLKITITANVKKSVSVETEFIRLDRKRNKEN